MIRLTLLAGLLAGAALAADPLPTVPPSCDLTAVAPWTSAGEGYRVQAMTDGDDCAGASLSLALVSPHGRALWERSYGATTAVRRFYGVPGPSDMQNELDAWIAPADGKPAVSTDLPVWDDEAPAPDGFEPVEPFTTVTWAALRAAARPLFCFDDAPGYQTCVALGADDAVTEIGRRATR